MTKGGGVSKAVAEVVLERDRGRCFAWVTHHGYAMRGQQIHHRKPRRMGGSTDPEINQPANLIHLCSKCHDWIESHREAAYLHGWLVAAGDTPSKVPVLQHGTKAVLLDNDGLMREFVVNRSAIQA